MPINFWNSRYYDSCWTIGEWLISYAGGFVRRGLPGAVIHSAAVRWGLSPVHLAWLASLVSFVVLAALLWRFCRDQIDTALILSPLILLGPIIGGFFVRKDVFVVAVYGICLMSIQLFNAKKRLGAVVVNALCIIAVLSHESYGFWGLPSLLILLSVLPAKTDNSMSWMPRIIRSCFYLLPSIAAFLLCLVNKGSAADALVIHRTWQDLAGLLPSIGALSSNLPTGAIDAIGWSTRQGLRLSYSTLNDFSFLIWVPAAWMLTIYVCIQLFVGDKNAQDVDLKRLIILFQFLMVAPLFVLGWDFGRWIFLWISSSALLYGFMSSCCKSEALNIVDSLSRGGIARRIAPGIALDGTSRLYLLFLGIPECCWSLKGFVFSTPIGFSLGIARKALQFIVQ